MQGAGGSNSVLQAAEKSSGTQRILIRKKRFEGAA
jgi:hypothetical protein